MTIVGSKDLIGKTFQTYRGTKYRVIDYINSKNVLIEFCDDFKFQKKVTVKYMNVGKIKNPYDITICGVACLGVLPNGTIPSTTKFSKEYRVWHGMLQRCYDSKSLEKYPSYVGVTVDSRWHCFANFLEDLPKIENYEYWLKYDNFQLDKDIKSSKEREFKTINNVIDYYCVGKIYSLDTCMFVPSSVNSNEVNLRERGFYKITNIESGMVQTIDYYDVLHFFSNHTVKKRREIKVAIKERRSFIVNEYKIEFDNELYEKLIRDMIEDYINNLEK